MERQMVLGICGRKESRREGKNDQLKGRKSAWKAVRRWERCGKRV